MGTCRIEHGDFRGWKAIHLSNDLIKLVAVPDIGGRIMAYDLGPYPYVWIDPELAGKLYTPEEHQGDGSLAAWKNYGGNRTWPSPQGWDNDDQWHGPPDSVLDTGCYRVESASSDGLSATVTMTSPTNAVAGIQIRRQITIYADSTQVDLDLQFLNVSNRPRTWSIWDIMQLRAERTGPDGELEYDPGCVVTAPLNPASRHEKGFWVMFGSPDNPQWQVDKTKGLFVGNLLWELGKVGLDSRAGWAACANSAGYAFAARAPVIAEADYPDDGSAVEFFTVGRGRVGNLSWEGTQTFLVEVELLSPMHRMAPGESTDFHLEWGATRCPGPIVGVTEAGLTGRPLHLKRQGDYVTIEGTFGVFQPGNLLLEWQGQDGRTLASEDLGPVSPLGAVILDRVCLAPASATTGALVLQVGDRMRALVNAEVQAATGII